MHCLIWASAVGIFAVHLANSPLQLAAERRQLVLRQLVERQLDQEVACIPGLHSLLLVLPALPIPLLPVGYVILALPCIRLAKPLSPSTALVEQSFAFRLRATYPSLVEFRLF